MINDLKDVLSVNIRGMKRSAIRELLKYLNQPGLISFSGGFPAPQSFPVEELKSIIAEVMDITLFSMAPLKEITFYGLS